MTQTGLNVNRYTMAQQLPEYEASTLCLNSEPRTVAFGYDTLQTDSLVSATLAKGLYVFGLEESHMVFVWVAHEGNFVIQSSFVEGMVTVENLKKPQAKMLNVFGDLNYVAPITTNNELVKRWLFGTKVEVILPPN